MNNNHEPYGHEQEEGMININPSFKARTPYIFHFDDQTVVLGDPEYLKQVETFLLTADLATRTTYWDTGEEDPLDFDPDPEPEDMNSVGIEGDESVFWNAIESAIFQQTEWPEGEDAVVYAPHVPDWLSQAQSWYFDPICPPLGPGGPGGWVRRRAVDGRGYPVGLFQLTEADSFWVFASEEDLSDIMELCRSLARFRIGFDQVTPYLGPDDTIGSLALPIECRDALHEELMIRGVDVESMFWE
ncbi:hypothetical protein GMA10_04175 [Kocuria koreensis]|jgi:hypothetical protein|uniref:Uncharacterized protein n=1 Tax=Rothia koreensis TaxID=592378 RepID=A0A7K1LGV1_9MICC|nr:hypothetical protein [Rothia koreensis]MDN5618294.1 hypothetical protein [Kocuria sp.]MUN54415.1 hypothetical protein [Rothia koreensis]